MCAAAESSRVEIMTGRHIFTVDVEEYFQAEEFRGIASPGEWSSLPSRVERSVDQILTFLDRYEVQATFFVNAWLATEHPKLVRRIVDGKHELAAQGRRRREEDHPGAGDPEHFRAQLEKTRQILEDISGRTVMGFRAPSLSLPDPPGRAFDALADAGFYYDSSLLPTGRERVEYPEFSPDPHVIRREEITLLELPLTTVRFLGLRLPAQGGATFRQLPLAYTERAVRSREEDGRPAVFRIRAWEVDRFQPRLPTSPLKKVRHYWGLGQTLPRMERLVSKFEFTSVERYFHLPYQEWDEDGPPLGGPGPDSVRPRRASQG